MKKEFVAKHRLMYKGNLMGYKGLIVIKGRKSNTVDLALNFIETLEECFGFVVNTDNIHSNIEMTLDGKTLYSDKDTPVLTKTQVYKLLGFNDYKRYKIKDYNFILLK